MRESKTQTGIKYAQFSAVGISNMLVDVGVLNLLLIVGPTRNPELLVLYNVGALVLANTNSYLWNTLWTFKDQARHDAKQVGMFTAQGLLNVAVSSALLWLAAHGLRAHTDLTPWVGATWPRPSPRCPPRQLASSFCAFWSSGRRGPESGSNSCRR